MGEPSHPRHDLYAVGALVYFLALRMCGLRLQALVRHGHAGD